MKEKSTRQSYGEALVELANDMSNLIVFDADLSRSTRSFFC
jgi:transketolase